MRRSNRIHAALVPVVIGGFLVTGLSAVAYNSRIAAPQAAPPKPDVAEFVPEPVSSGRQRSLPRQTTPKPKGDMVFAAGDVLKLTFFEPIGADQPAGQRRRAAAPLAERPELSGEYRVQMDGSIYVPLVGLVAAAGTSPGELEEALAEATRTALGAELKAAIVVANREPVYVTGPDIKAGAVKYVPGMMAVQALTLAGALNEGNELWRRMEIARERERMGKAAEKLKKMLAHRDVLLAERAGQTPAASARLREMLGHEEAERQLTAELALRAMELKRRELAKTSLTGSAEAMRQELHQLREKLLVLDGGQKSRARRLEAIGQRVSRGGSTEPLLNTARNELSDIQEKWHEARLAVVRMEQKVQDAEQQIVRFDFDGSSELERTLRSLTSEIAEVELTMATVGQVLLSISDHAVAQAPGPRSFWLIRRTAEGVRRTVGDEMMALQPGDVLQVGS